MRWHVELDLRNIKATLGMEALRCMTPQMNEKEMWVYFLGYNLIRLLMCEAALQAEILPRQIASSIRSRSGLPGVAILGKRQETNKQPCYWC